MKPRHLSVGCIGGVVELSLRVWQDLWMGLGNSYSPLKIRHLACSTIGCPISRVVSTSKDLGGCGVLGWSTMAGLH